jgi:hypothetical protein
MVIGPIGSAGLIGENTVKKRGPPAALNLAPNHSQTAFRCCVTRPSLARKERFSQKEDRDLITENQS